MSTVVFLNGQFLGDAASGPLDQARVSAFDAGFQHGVGLFETFLGGVDAGEPWAAHLDEHLDRLAVSARELGLSDQLRTVALSQTVLETIRRSGLARARVRLTITAGDLSLLARAQAQQGAQPSGTTNGASRQADPTVLIVAQPATVYPRPMLDRGVSVTIADTRVSPLDPMQAHKTLNYWWRLKELQVAAAKNAGEALVLSVSNHLVGGCVSSVLLVKDGDLLVPFARGEEDTDDGALKTKTGVALPSPVLPGVTRAWVIDRAERLGLVARRKMLSVQDLLDAQEVMLTNSSWGVLPVVQIEGSQIGAGTPGPVTRDLVEAWGELWPGADDTR